MNLHCGHNLISRLRTGTGAGECWVRAGLGADTGGGEGSGAITGGAIIIIGTDKRAQQSLGVATTETVLTWAPDGATVLEGFSCATSIVSSEAPQKDSAMAAWQHKIQAVSSQAEKNKIHYLISWAGEHRNSHRCSVGSGAETLGFASLETRNFVCC